MLVILLITSVNFLQCKVTVFPFAINMCLIFFFLTAPHRILVPLPGMVPRLSAMEEQSPNHWTAREFPGNANSY